MVLTLFTQVVFPHMHISKLPLLTRTAVTLGLTLMALFNLNYLYKDHVYKYSHQRLKEGS